MSEASPTPARPVTLALRIAPQWDGIKEAWTPCREMLARVGFDDDATYQLAMVTQELLENAVKYGAFRADERISLEVRAARDDVTIEVKSRVAGDDAHVRRFDRMVQWIRGFQDPFEAYVERMKAVSTQPYSNGESGLGLTRVAYEGRCMIDFYVDDEGVLAVSAVYRSGVEGTWER